MGGSTELDPRLIRKIAQLFPPEDRAEAERILREQCGRELPLMGDASDAGVLRVQAAFLKISEGSLERLCKYANNGKQDYRDILVWSGFGTGTPWIDWLS